MTGLDSPKRSLIDRLLYAIVTRGWNKDNVGRYRDAMRRHTEALSSDILESFQAIDAKATGLLAHVSLMIAGLGLMAPLVAQEKVEEGIIVAEIAVYLVISIGCLRCLSVFRPAEISADAEQLKAYAERELIIRNELFGYCIRGAIWFTILVLILLPIMYFDVTRR